ncbi:ChaN family lipoprotein [Ruegeria sp. PrR005]|uniref:ChaN family lipoprotein n=1 Tax=Ruegeria sp. PrR005 TaxID=2706882 RepID=A0A6B2NQR8_9RHOB|nr:ChaN family lipoprotein [Ruegeria sp. PrR005]NDW45143.1 ChaN family lipoprotein [Ruegeria sp. PrR005]
MKAIAIPGLALVLFLVAPIKAAMSGDLIPADVLNDMRQADVVILGETHDNPQHHLVQAEAVTALAPSAVVWEMLSEEGAARLTRKAVQDPEELARILRWAELGWPPLAMYLPVFQAADAPVYGALVPRTAARAAMETGAAAALGADAARFGLGVSLSDEEQAAREADQQASHCNAMPPEMLPKLVAVQRLRDAVLARAILRAREETGGPIAVITGNGHARSDRGIPVFLSRVQPGLRVFTLGQSEEGAIEGTFDAVIDSPAAPREDPCAAFDKS